MKLRAVLGYSAAGLTLAAAILTPFLLMGTFAQGVAGLGLHVDEMYSGGPTLRTIPHGAYSIAIHRTVYPRMLQDAKPFVQMDWSPVTALPAHVSDAVDIDGDGKPDVLVSFDVPGNAKAPLHVDVAALSAQYETMENAGKEKYSRLIVRVDNSILVRVPVARP